MGLPTEDNIYGYSASQPAAIIFAVLNSILLTYHAYLSLWLPCRRSHNNIRYKHRYTICLFVAAALSTAGYAIRVASINKASDVALYAVQSSYVVIAPIFVCASLYWQLKNLVLLLLPPTPQDAASGGGRHPRRLFGVNPLWLGRIFIASDVTSFMTQAAGSGIASSGNWEGNTLDIGTNVLLTGLALQLATFTAYLVFLGKMVLRARRCGGLKEDGMAGGGGATAASARGARKVLLGVWIAAGFVQTRTIFRMVEFALGIEGYPFQHEWMLYVFDSVPMVVALAVLAWWHPVKHLQAKRFYEEAGPGEVETKGVSPDQSLQHGRGGVAV